MKTLFRILLAQIVIQSVLAKPANSPPVCIVGAGPAGLSAASRLESKGYKTVIFEKQPEVGGKCQAYYQNGNFHPLGAVLFSNASYPETLKVIDASGVPAANTSARIQWNFNGTSGEVVAVPPLSPEFIAALSAEIPKYASLWQQQFAPVSTAGYKNGVPKDLTVSTAQWMTKNGFQALYVVFVSSLALYGYGDITETPIIYAMQYMTPDIVGFFTGLHEGYFIDYHAVWTRFASSSIKGPIRTSAEILSIQRDKSPSIKYILAGSKKSQQQRCSDVILAFPPTVAALQAARLDLTNEEIKLFSSVYTENYYSSAVDMENIPFGQVFSATTQAPTVPPEDNGEPVLFTRFSPLDTVTTVWSIGPFKQYQAESTARELLTSNLSRVNKSPGNATATSEPITAADVRAFRKWDYFPHVETDELARGWYKKFNKLQGQRRTFWASGLNGFETVEWAIRAGLDIADSYF